MYLEIDPGPSTAATLTSPHIGWTRVGQAIGGDGKDYEIWVGLVNIVATANVTITFTGSVSASIVEVGWEEFSSSRGSNWYIDSSGFIPYPNGTVIQYPALNSRNQGALYWGYGKTTNVGSAGSTPGYNYSVTPQLNVVCWNTNIGNDVEAPTAATSTGFGSSISAVISDYGISTATLLNVA
jgi:hypothetical protein